MVLIQRRFDQAVKLSRSGDRSGLQRVLARLGRALDPEAAVHRQALHRMLEEWRRREELRERDHVARLKALERAVAELTRESSLNFRQLARLQRLSDRQRALLSEFVRYAKIDRRAVEAEQRVATRLARVSRSKWPVIVGPWTGEVGFELLYWIPFLQWVREAYPFELDRLIVLSRGGVRAWYGHVAKEYEEIFSYTSTKEFRDATTSRKKQKHIGSFDRKLIRQVMRARGLMRAHVLHPTLMYSLYNAFWRYTATVKRLEAYARFRRLCPVDDAMCRCPLPDNFIAVRFYFSECFPDTAENRAFAARIVEGLASRHHVVLLNSDLVVDEHRDYVPVRSGRVHFLSQYMSPETNLAIQTAAIIRASAFVGTYGGYSYLAPFYGVPSLSFFSRHSFKQHHLELAHRAFQHLGTARLMLMDIRQLHGLAETLAGVMTSWESFSS